MGKGRSQNNQVAQEAGNTRSVGFPLRHKALLTRVAFKALVIGPDNNEMMSYVTLATTQLYMYYTMHLIQVQISNVSKILGKSKYEP